MPVTHHYEVSLRWLGNRGDGTRDYRSYDRTHEVWAPGKPVIACSADPAFRGQPERWNPEELLVAALAQCHMLWYLHLAAVQGVIVTDYRDNPAGTMDEDEHGAGRFREVVLRPEVTIAEASTLDRAQGLHRDAHGKCFIARSVNFVVRHEPVTRSVPRR